jgi:Zn-dependent protease with chaperone function
MSTEELKAIIAHECAHIWHKDSRYGIYIYTYIYVNIHVCVHMHIFLYSCIHVYKIKISDIVYSFLFSSPSLNSILQ